MTERLIGVQGAFAPGRFAFVALFRERAGLGFADLSRRCGDRGSGLDVVVAEGA
ncbi:hypothetical protein GTY73_30305 [Streptomyces sp. SID8354]|nr:hypothetical protein [Streptomyces sp. SID8354]